MAQTIGFIGLGIMGRPMAKNLLKAGHPVVVHSRSQGPVDELVGAGAKRASSAKEVAGQVDVLITMLSDAVAVLDSAPPALEALGDGGLWIQMSTIGLEGTERCAQLAERYVKFACAPFSACSSVMRARPRVALPGCSNGPHAAR